MLPFPSLRSRALIVWTTLFGLSLTHLPAAPGDLELEIIAAVGDEFQTPNSVVIADFEYFVSLDSAPIAIDDSGIISFAASVDAEDDEYGFYRALGPGQITPILQSLETAPGVTANDPSQPNGFRVPNFNASPMRGYAMSQNGTHHALTMWTEFDGSFLYAARDGALEQSPRTWPARLSDTHNPWEAVEISDGRGTTQTRSGGSGADMVVANNGDIYWDAGAGAILRSKGPGDLSAIMFTGTAAPGYDESENAMLDAPYRFRGIDDAGNAIFHCRVTKTSGISNAVFYHSSFDNSLMLLWDSAATSLPAGEGQESVTAEVDAESVFMTGDGDVYLRGRVGSTRGGFWKVTPLGDGPLTELLGLFSSNGFNPVLVDGLEELSFRNIHLADWAVSENGTVFFSADLAGSAGTSTTSAQEGIWKIDPTELTITTVARFGQNADEGGTNATYAVFSDLTAAGDDKLAFIAELSDGNRGLFGTDKNGGVIRIALEGSPLIECEESEENSLACNTVATIEFTPDHAGEDLIASKGTPGLNGFGEMAFLATFENQRKALVRAKFEGDERPIGNTYIWDGGAGDNNWHTVVDGRSNWVDAVGTPWNVAPPADGTPVISIGTDYIVEIVDEDVYVRSITNLGSILGARKKISFESIIDIHKAATLEFQAAIDGPSINNRGLLIKAGSSEVDFRVPSLKLFESELIVEDGVLDAKCDLVTVTRGGIDVDFGELVLESDLSFVGDDCEVKGGLVTKITLLASEIRSTGVTEFDMGVATSCVFGRKDSGNTIDLEFGGSNESDGGRIVLKGRGTYRFYEAFRISEHGRLECRQSRYGGGRVEIDIPADAVIQAEGRLSNLGSMKMTGGGITGNFHNRGPFTATGPLAVLDCENFSEMEFNEDVLYGIINGGAIRATFLLKDGADLLPKDPDLSELIIKDGQTINVRSWDSSEASVIEFHSFDSPNMEGTISVEDAAAATVSKVNTGLERASFWAGEFAEIHIKDLVFSWAEILGKGKAVLEGEVNPLDDADGLLINIGEVEIRNAQIFGPVGEQFALIEFRPDIFTLRAQETGTAKVLLNNVTTHKGTILFSYVNVEVTVEGTLTLGDAAYAQSSWKLKGDVRSSDGFGSFILGAYPPGPRRFNSRLSFLPKPDPKDGRLLVCPDLEEGLLFEPSLDFATRTSSLTVGTNSNLILNSPNIITNLENGILEKGTWIIEDFAALEVLNLGGQGEALNIETIGKDASLTFGKPHASRPTFNNLPSPENDLLIEGELILKDTILNMNGKRVFNKGNAKGKKIIGDFQMIRDDVQGIIKLAGNFEIEGNVTTDAVISMGASPGTGIITGDLTLLPGAELRVEFAGEDPGTGFDFLEVGGTANLDGQLTLSLIDGYEPDNGTAFLFLEAGAVAGNFAEIEQDTLGRERRFAVTSGAEGLTATMEALSIASYADWRNAFFSAEEAADDLISGINADPDADGIVNLAEYLSGGLPEFSSLQPLFQVETAPDRFGIQLANGVNDYTWELQASTNLVDWTSVATNVLEEDVEEDITVLGIELQDATPAGNRFYRLGIDEASP